MELKKRSSNPMSQLARTPWWTRKNKPVCTNSKSLLLGKLRLATPSLELLEDRWALAVAALSTGLELGPYPVTSSLSDLRIGDAPADSGNCFNQVNEVDLAIEVEAPDSAEWENEVDGLTGVWVAPLPSRNLPLVDELFSDLNSLDGSSESIFPGESQYSNSGAPFKNEWESGPTAAQSSSPTSFRHDSTSFLDVSEASSTIERPELESAVGSPASPASSGVKSTGANSGIVLSSDLGRKDLVVRVERTEAISSQQDLPYRLFVFSSTGEEVREGVIRFQAGEKSVEVKAPGVVGFPRSSSEIVILTLESSSSSQKKGDSLVLFREGGPGSCSDRALLEAFHRAGAEVAMEELVRRHHDLVLASCNQILANWHDSEDVSQMVFVTLAQKPVSYHASLAAWLHTVARHSALMFLRSRKRRQKHEQQAARPDQIQPEEDRLSHSEEIRLALKRMPSALSQAVRLRYLEGLSQVEAAEVAGCPRGTLSQRASLGLQWLRHFLRRKEV